MSAGTRLKESIINALAEVQELTGVYDGPPARAAYPYVALDSGTELDWSHKTGVGRELTVGLTIWDNQPSRLEQLADAVEQRLEQLKAVSGWHLVQLRFLRRRVVRDVAGPWAAALDFRARLLSQQLGD